MLREQKIPVPRDWVRVQMFTAIHFVCVVALAIFAKASVASLMSLRMAFYFDPPPTLWGSVSLFFGEMNKALIPLVRDGQHAMVTHSGYTVAIIVGLWSLLTLINVRLDKVVQERKARNFIRQMSMRDRARFEAIRDVGSHSLAA